LVRFKKKNLSPISAFIREESTKPKQDKASHIIVAHFVLCTSSNSKSQQGCSYCNAVDHILAHYGPFGRLSVMQRIDFLKSASLCINCMRKGHTSSKCKFNKYRACGRSHHVLQYRFKVSDNSLALPPPREILSPSINQGEPSHVMVMLGDFGHVDRKRTHKNQRIYILARALLDSCSQTNFIAEDLADRPQTRKEESWKSIFP